MASSCEFEFAEYIDENSIDPNLICSICHKPLKDPVCTPCDHTYGRACITHWLTTSINYSCPMCQKQPLLITELTKTSAPLRNILDQLRVRCLLCDETGLQRGNFADHINKFCPKATVGCQAADIRCPWKGLRHELQNHVQSCLFESLRPVLAVLIAENRQLLDQVHKHDDEIKKLTQQLSQLKKTPTNDSGDESDGSMASELSTADVNQRNEDAIFVQNLPTDVKFNDVFDFFSKIGRIKFNANTHRADVFIFKKPNSTSYTAKVTYVDKESVTAAIAQLDSKMAPQWNTRLRVKVFTPFKRNANDSARANYAHHSAHNEKSAKEEQPNSTTEPPPASAKPNKNRRPHRPPHGDQPKNQNYCRRQK